MKSFVICILPVKLYLFLRRLSLRIFCNRYYNELQEMRKIITSDGYSYKSFDDRKAIFIHIPKCAGISINKALFGNLAGGHKGLDDYILVFGAKDFTRYFKFTFVRNPWDRLVSAYFFLKNGGLNRWDKQFFEVELAHYQDFGEFVRCWLNEKNIYKFHHFKPQISFLTDKYNKVSIDYVGYFENIDADFKYIARRIGVDVTLNKENSVTRQNYQEFYDSDTKDIVARVYREDIKLFNYNFDGVYEYRRDLS